jgi:hypothetical protein
MISLSWAWGPLLSDSGEVIFAPLNSPVGQPVTKKTLISGFAHWDASRNYSQIGGIPGQFPSCVMLESVETRHQ